MSAFLGPIHTWLFNKVVFQNEMVKTIENLAKENEWIDGINLNRYGELEQGELAEICDPNNIHGWLQERVSLVENKLAYLVTALIKEHPERKDAILSSVYKLGKAHPMPEVSSADEVFSYLDTLLLNGMPCDRVNVIVEQAKDHVMWKQEVNIHELYWTAVQGDELMFYAIRAGLISGILEDSAFTFRELGNDTFEVSRG